MTRRFRLVLFAGAAYVVALGLIAAWPTHVDRHVRVLNYPPATWLIDLGMAPDKAYGLVEWSANIAVFIPFGILLMLASLRMTWVRAALAGLVVSGVIEIGQAVALPGRTASFDDVSANTLGATLGALGVVIGRGVARRRSLRRADSSTS